MKSNPARELADLLESWTTDDQRTSLAGLRSTVIDAHPYDETFWAGIDRAVALLEEYRRVVNTLPNEQEAEYHRSQFHALHALVYAPDIHWGTQGSATARNAAKPTLTTLRLAAGSLDSLLPEELQQSEADTIVELLQESLELTDALPPGVERDHLRQTIGLAIQFANDIDRFSGEAATVVATQVASELRALAEDDAVDPEARSKFGRIWRYLSLQLGINMGATYAVQAISASTEAIKSIAG